MIRRPLRSNTFTEKAPLLLLCTFSVFTTGLGYTLNVLLVTVATEAVLVGSSFRTIVAVFYLSAASALLLPFTAFKILHIETVPVPAAGAVQVKLTT